MNDKAKDQTTRWENVKGRSRWLRDTMDAVTYLKEGLGELDSSYTCLALCEEMDRMQEELKTEIESLRLEIRNLRQAVVFNRSVEEETPKE